jgi:spermidine synthase
LHKSDIYQRFLFWLVLCCFFLSGAAGLIYEVLWVRMIDKIIGSAPFAVATVLSIFMGGLALGSWVVGRYINHFSSKNALLAFYGKLEIAIGVYALALPFLIETATPFYSLAYHFLFEYFWFYQFFAFMGAFILLILPAGLMGGTMPVLCQFYISRIDHLGTRTGRLYGLNTIGAAFGAMLCGFVLINSFGAQKTLYIAAGINFFVGILCILVSRRKETFFTRNPSVSRTSKNPVRQKNHAVSQSTHSAGPISTCALCLFAVSGFCAMAYQVFWTRLITLLIGPTTYSFTLVVSTFIIGLSAGSIIFGRLGDKIKRVFLLLVITQIAAAGSALAVSHFLGNSQFLFAKLIYQIQDDFETMMLVQSLILFVILISPTLFLGAAFPLVSRIYTHSISMIGKSIGVAYAINTIGAIIGSFAAGFILIPLVGKENGLKLVILFQFMAAFLAYLHGWFSGWFETGDKRYIERYQWIAAPTLAIAAVFLISFYPSWNRNILSRGWYRNFQDIEVVLERTTWSDAFRFGPELLAQQQNNLELVFYGDGIGGFTTVEKETTSIGTIEYALNNSGKPDASSHGDRLTQTLSGHFPLLFHQDPKKILVIGLASGMTIGEVLLYPVEQVDVLEINDQVVKACQLFFTPFNNDCLNDHRTRLIIQDGRNHLALTREKYDVIISEPSNPWMSGLSNLYSLDFFKLVRSRLNENGIFAQWIQSYEIDWDTFVLMGRTFKEVFPEGALIKLGPGDYMLMGFAGQNGFDWKIPEKNINYAHRSSNASFFDYKFLAWFVVTEDFDHFFGEGPLHTDNHPRLEFSAPKKLYWNGSDSNHNLDQFIEKRRLLSPATQNIIQAHNAVDHLLDLLEFAASVNIPLFHSINPQDLEPSRQNRYQQIVKSFCENALVPSYSLFPDITLKRECAETQIVKMRKKMASWSSKADDHYNLGLALIAAERTEEAVSQLETTVEMDPFHLDGYLALGLLMAEQENMEKAVYYFTKILKIAPMNAQAQKYIGMAQFRQGNLEQAIFHLSKAVEVMPDDNILMNELDRALAKLKKIQ